MQHGTTVLRRPESGSSSSSSSVAAATAAAAISVSSVHSSAAAASTVVLRLENDGRTLSWTRPAWTRAGPASQNSAAAGASTSSAAASGAAVPGSAASSSAAGTGAAGVGSASATSGSSSAGGGGQSTDDNRRPREIDDSDLRITSALIYRYQQQLPYRVEDFDDGFVDLAVVKDVYFRTPASPPLDSLVAGASYPADPTKQLSSAMAASSLAASASARRSRTCSITLLFGVGMADNRTIEFAAPEGVAAIWRRGLTRLVLERRARRIRHGPDDDLRVRWLQEQYLQLYFDSGRCRAPTSADAIRVCLHAWLLIVVMNSVVKKRLPVASDVSCYQHQV